jgi:ketosteroid isomerase-like protein
MAQKQAPVAHGAGGTLTRGASRYKGLETALLQAQQDKDQNTASRLLADDFEIWSAEKIDATPREVWEQSWTSGNLTWFRIRNIAVREFGDTAIVSFLLDRRGDANGKPAAPTAYVVDVWQQKAGKLSVRYITVPGHPTAQLLPTGMQ